MCGVGGGGRDGDTDLFSSSPSNSNVKPELSSVPTLDSIPKPLAANIFLEQLQHKADRNPTHSQVCVCVRGGREGRSRLREKITKLKSHAKMKSNKVAAMKVLTSRTCHK